MYAFLSLCLVKSLESHNAAARRRIITRILNRCEQEVSVSISNYPGIHVYSFLNFVSPKPQNDSLEQTRVVYNINTYPVPAPC